MLNTETLFLIKSDANALNEFLKWIDKNDPNGIKKVPEERTKELLKGDYYMYHCRRLNVIYQVKGVERIKGKDADTKVRV